MRFFGFRRNCLSSFLVFAFSLAMLPALAAPHRTLTPEEVARAGQLVRELARAKAQPRSVSASQPQKEVVEIETIKRIDTPDPKPGTPSQTPAAVEEKVTGTTLETYDPATNEIVRTTEIKKVERRPAGANLAASQRSMPPVKTVTRSEIPTSSWLTERARIAPLPSRFPFHPERAVAIIPFVNRTKEPSASQHVREEAEKSFARLGFEIIPATVVENVMLDLQQAVGVPLNTREATRLAKTLRARYLVTGLVQEYKTENNLRAGALISTGIIGGGITAYGKCRLESQLFDASRRQYIWENKAIGSAKKQLIGWAQGRDRLFDYSVQRAVKDLYQPLELLKTVPENPSALSEFQKMRTLDSEFPVEWFNRIYN